MNNEPLVSVCLPLYNGEKFLAQAIQSVLDQTYKNFELIIADDGSKDKGPSIAQDLAKTDKRIKYQQNPKNLGLFQNYNECIRLACGKYIKLFAQDDLFDPKILARMVEVLEQNSSVSLVSCARTWLDDKGKVIIPVSSNEMRMARPFESDRQFSGKWISTETLREFVNWLGEPCSMMFRKEQAGPGFDARFLQLGDIDYWYRLLEQGDYFFLADPLCSFRKHSGSTTVKNRKTLTSLLDWLVLANKHRHLIAEMGETDADFAQRFTRRYVYAITGTFYSAPRNDKVKEKDGKLEFLMDCSNILAAFEPDHNVPRDVSDEFRAFAVSCLHEASRMQNEYRLVKHVVKTQRKIIIGMEIDHEEKIMAMQEEIDELRGALSELGNSLSWKVTAPLRNVRKLLN
jgi:glycosyltransferase involved in cell wall biosynthesis